MSAERLDHRGYTLTVVAGPPHWTVRVTQPATAEAEANLPVLQDDDRQAAIARARDLVDELLDGRPLHIG